MAKAKEYVQQLKEQGCSPEAQSAVLLKLMDEVGEIIRQRKCHSDGAYEAVFRELRQKWESICNTLPQMMRHGFSVAIQTCYPNLYPILVRKKTIEAL